MEIKNESFVEEKREEKEQVIAKLHQELNESLKTLKQDEDEVKQEVLTLARAAPLDESEHQQQQQPDQVADEKDISIDIQGATTGNPDDSVVAYQVSREEYLSGFEQLKNNFVKREQELLEKLNRERKERKLREKLDQQRREHVQRLKSLKRKQELEKQHSQQHQIVSDLKERFAGISI